VQSQLPARIERRQALRLRPCRVRVPHLQNDGSRASKAISKVRWLESARYLRCWVGVDDERGLPRDEDVTPSAAERSAVHKFSPKALKSKPTQTCEVGSNLWDQPDAPSLEQADGQPEVPIQSVSVRSGVRVGLGFHHSGANSNRHQHTQHPACKSPDSFRSRGSL